MSFNSFARLGPLPMLSFRTPTIEHLETLQRLHQELIAHPPSAVEFQSSPRKWAGLWQGVSVWPVWAGLAAALLR